VDVGRAERGTTSLKEFLPTTLLEYALHRTQDRQGRRSLRNTTPLKSAEQVEKKEKTAFYFSSWCTFVLFVVRVFDISNKKPKIEVNPIRKGRTYVSS
jgi:hypothetical protein